MLIANDHAVGERWLAGGTEVEQHSIPRWCTHVVPDQSIIELADDLSDLKETNIWIGDAEVVGGTSSDGRGLDTVRVASWMRRGCHATVLPLDGRDGDHMDWLVESIKGVVGQLVKGDGPETSCNSVRVGLVWKRTDGQDSDRIDFDGGRNRFGSDEGSATADSSRVSRRDSGRIKPKVVVHVGQGGDVEGVWTSNVDRVMQFLVDGRRKRVREDCVVSVVLYDESECIFAMTNFIIAKTRISFMHLVGLVEEIGQLHAQGVSGNFALKAAQLTPLNVVASPYITGDAKIYVMSYPNGQDLEYVSKIVTVCASSQTLRTDMVWVGADAVPCTTTGDDEGRCGDCAGSWVTVVNRVDESRDMSSLLHSPSISMMRESLKLQASQQLSAAAKSAIRRVTKEGSPTYDMPMTADAENFRRSLPEKRMLNFSSLRSSLGKVDGEQVTRQDDIIEKEQALKTATWMPTKNFMSQNLNLRASRDVFSSIPQDNIDSISLHRPTTEVDEIPEFVESGPLASEEMEECSAVHQSKEGPETSIPHPSHDSLNSSRIVDEVQQSIEVRVNDRLLETVKELEQKLQWSEMQRLEMRSTIDALREGPVSNLDYTNHDSIIAALREERKSTKQLEHAAEVTQQSMLSLHVEMSSKDKEIALLQARINALENDSDISSSYQMCEDALERAQAQAQHLRLENAELMKQLAMLQVSEMVHSHSPILPEDEDYDVDGAEGRIIYQLHDKIKSLLQKVSRLEKEKENLIQSNHDLKKETRIAEVNKKVAQKALAKVSKLQKDVNRMRKQIERDSERTHVLEYPLTPKPCF